LVLCAGPADAAAGRKPWPRIRVGSWVGAGSGVAKGCVRGSTAGRPAANTCSDVLASANVLRGAVNWGVHAGRTGCLETDGLWLCKGVGVEVCMPCVPYHVCGARRVSCLAQYWGT